MDKFNKLFKKYGFKIVFQPLHKKNDILQYSDKKDKVNNEEYFTVISKSGHVVGRLFDIKKPFKKVSKNQIKKIINIINIYEYKEIDLLVKELEQF